MSANNTVEVNSIGEVDVETVDYTMTLKRQSGAFIRVIKWKLTGLKTDPKQVTNDYVAEFLDKHRKDIVRAKHLEDLEEGA